VKFGVAAAALVRRFHSPWCGVLLDVAAVESSPPGPLPPQPPASGRSGSGSRPYLWCSTADVAWHGSVTSRSGLPGQAAGIHAGGLHQPPAGLQMNGGEPPATPWCSRQGGPLLTKQSSPAARGGGLVPGPCNKATRTKAKALAN
jgi:hypothetical protein